MFALRSVLILVAVSGCDQLFKINEVATDAAIDARILPPHCFYEDFAGAALDPDSWAIASAEPTAPTVSVIDQAIQIAPQPTEPGSNYNSIRSLATYDLTGGQASVELIEPTLQMSGVPTETQFYIDLDADNRYQFSVLLGTVATRTRTDGTDAPVKSTTYLATSFHWLRLRHDATANQIAWEVATKEAPDDWSTLSTKAVGVPVTAVHIDVAAGTYNQVPQPGQARFDNVLVEAPSCNR